MRLVLVAATVLVFSSCHRHRALMPVFGDGPPTRQAVLETWLTKSCGVGEKRDLEAAMRRFGDEVTPDFISAFENGPTPDERATVEAYERAALVQMKGNLERLGLAERDKWMVRDRVESVHVQEGVERYVRNYKAAALAGLGVIGTAKAWDYLEKVKATLGSTFQENARVILATRKG